MKQARNTMGTLVITGGDTARTSRYASRAEKAAARAEQAAEDASGAASAAAGFLNQTDLASRQAGMFEASASQSAARAEASADEARSAQAAAETARTAAETAAEDVADSAAQIQSNRQNIVEINRKTDCKANFDAYHTQTASGQSVLLDGCAENTPMEITVEAPVRQSGSGDPTSTNKRPFVPYDSVSLYRSGENASEYDEFPISLEDAPSPVYGFHYDTRTGEIMIEWIQFTISAVASVGTSGGLVFTRNTITSYGVGINNTADNITILADSLKPSVENEAGTVRMISNGTVIALRLEDQTLTTKDAINAYLAENPVTVCYKLKNPIKLEIPDQPIVITTVGGINRVWSNAGLIKELKYRVSADAYARSRNKWQGLNAVAFGTSLTYRAMPGQSGGYLNYLPELSGMEIDNQGLGNSRIVSDMMAKITGYTGYADKRVAILEGFVNDWAKNSPLGTYTDVYIANEDNSACACVRQAIEHVYAQNPNITMFLVLDSYGKHGSASDETSTKKNAAGLTQYEYYEEIAKVAESMGIHVIKLYAESGMSERTPGYFIDNIHPSPAGAKQTANTIWCGIKRWLPDVIPET